MIRHIVMFSFKEDTEDSEIMNIDRLFKTLPLAIPEVLDFESGVNISPEDHDKGFTHIYSLSFASKETRDIYLYHSKHRAFSEQADKTLDDVLVFDYEV